MVMMVVIMMVMMVIVVVMMIMMMMVVIMMMAMIRDDGVYSIIKMYNCTTTGAATRSVTSSLYVPVGLSFTLQI